MKKAGFTLIELIVVITILAILGTIAFIGFKGYTSDARDSKVTTDIANLHNVLSILKSSEGSVPMPDSAIAVKSGTLDITFEGEVGDNVRNALKASSETKTPSGENYKYAVNGVQKDFTLVGMLENETASITTNAFAEGEEDTMFFKGDEVLTLFDANNNFIGGNVDVAVSGISKAYIGDVEMGITSEVVQKLPQSIKENKGVMYDSCKATLDAGFSNGDGVYNIIQNGKTQKVYCDMTTAGGGWTAFYATDKSNITTFGEDKVPGMHYQGKLMSNFWSADLTGLNFDKVLISLQKDDGTVNNIVHNNISGTLPFNNNTDTSYDVDNIRNDEGACTFRIRYRTTYSANRWEVGINDLDNFAFDAHCTEGVGLEVSTSNVIRSKPDGMTYDKAIFYIK